MKSALKALFWGLCWCTLQKRAAQVMLLTTEADSHGVQAATPQGQALGCFVHPCSLPAVVGEICFQEVQLHWIQCMVYRGKAGATVFISVI